MNTVSIGGRGIGAGEPCYVIAEAGVNHNGDVALARRLVDAAATTGADAVKFQTFSAEEVVAPSARRAAYQVANVGGEGSQYDLLKPLELGSAVFKELKERSVQRGLVFLSTPFDHASIDLLAGMGVPALKVPSGEITNGPYLQHVARTGLPVILSTGMSTLGEVESALTALSVPGSGPVILLHCVSNYPAAYGDMNLKALETLRRAFGRPVGLSDHSEGIDIALAAVALGACLIEKHFTLDKALPGPDHKASLDVAEFKRLVDGIRHVEQAMGDGIKRPVASELDTAAVARRSLVAACDIPAATVIVQDMVAVLRPGTGLPTSALPLLLGRKTRRAMTRGELFDFSLLD